MSRINLLRSQILRAKTAYYYSASPIMPDSAYDALEDELRLLSPSDPVLALVGSPVPANSMLTKAQHLMPMGSQSKINSEPEFRAWYAKNGVKKVHASLKADGGSAAAYFSEGRMIQAITRGDGQVGEDVTVNAMKFQCLPAFAGTDGVGFTGSVRFEVVLTVSDWEKIDPAKSKNPRNAGNGIVGRKNGSQSEFLTAFAFDIDETRNGEPVVWLTETQKTDRLTELGFNVIDHECFDNADGVIEYFNKITKGRGELPMWIDGVVVKSDSIEHQRQLGVTSGRHKGQTAWKFGAEGGESVLEAVVVSGGHTGGLYPTAQFSPVEIGGTTVCNASLANYDEIERLGIAIGDKIFVVKSNDVIPKISHVIERPESRTPIAVPCSCPFCGGEVGKKINSGGDEGVILVCKNPDCSKKSTGKIGRWISSLDILGIGDSVLEAMVDTFDLSDAGDLYALNKNASGLANLMINAEREIRLGEKRANSILEAIDAKRKLSLSEFLGSLGIDYLGKRRVELMIKAADGELNTLADWRNGKLRGQALAAKAGVPSIGDQIQTAIDAMSAVIDKMLANGVTVMAFEKPVTSDNALKTICISGKLPSGKKKSDYESPLLSRGFQLVDDVAKGLSFLVLADPNSTSSKSQKAQKLGVAVISEDALIELIGA
jgi:DNA ligase (NAD+)